MGSKGSGRTPKLSKDEIKARKEFYEEKGYVYAKPDGWFEKANQKIKKARLKNDSSKVENLNKQYKTWYIMLGVEDLEGLTNEEIDKLIYKYKGQKHLYDARTKEDGSRWYEKYNGNEK